MSLDDDHGIILYYRGEFALWESNPNYSDDDYDDSRFWEPLTN